MDNKSVQIIRRMVASGYAAELRALLLGESSYNKPDSPGVPSEPSARRLRTDALLHLNFVARSGLREGQIKQDGKYYAAYPAEFDEWIRSGAPGVTIEELSAFAADHPDIGV
jgi:hypothetical protein